MIALEQLGESALKRQGQKRGAGWRLKNEEYNMAKETTMNAVVCGKYGPPEVLQIMEVARPVPRPDEVCIRIHASAVTASDIFIRSAGVTLALQVPFRLMMGFSKPRHSVVGFVFSGVVDEAGEKIRRFKKGDQVYGTTGFRLGAYAEYRCMKETDSRQHGCVALKPKNLTHEESTAAAYGGLLALQYAERGNIQRGDNVLIYGASGTSGTIAVQYAKHLGGIVTGVCSTKNIDFVKSLGADEVLDYTRVNAPPAGARYDLVLDSVGGTKTSKLKRACRNALRPQGKYVSIDDGDLQLSSDRMLRLTELIEAGTIKAILDRTYPLDDIVDAHRFVESGHKRGGVAVTIRHAVR
jgi:NADPH:quinone reductase-like Zn-dependent oxidoreductase